MTDERITINVEDGIADVRLDRGEKHNALDYPMFQALDGATDELSARKDVRCVVLSGNGPSFCSGLDFPSFMSGGVGVDDMIEPTDGNVANLVQRVSYDWLRLPMPVIAALHGNVLGGGAQIALGADIRIAAPDTRISIMEIRYGLIPDMGISQALPLLVRQDAAKELTFSGRMVEGDEALTLGLVTRIADDPRAAALAMAREIAGRSPHAIRSAKQLLNDAYRGRSEEALALEADLQRALIGTPNQIAAVTATMSKQAGEFADPD
ncbi:MAG: crotonase/enoyl-CoA hydratase family protein [Actinomycetota bacterium]|nr:crotonase/enoyl-CoA hydratase family protein [Actinomycetota bacterium]